MSRWREEPSCSTPGPCLPSKRPSPACCAASPKVRKSRPDFAGALGYHPEQDVLVFAAHLYIEGALPSRSERALELTDTYATAATALPQVAYAALGHIHRPQSIGRTGFPTRYAGSPLQLDFGEVGENKSLVLVTAEPSRPAHPQVVPL